MNKFALLVVFVSAFVSLALSALISVDATKYTYRFTQSVPGFIVYTAPVTLRVRDTMTVPGATGTTLDISCAREELESFQIIIDKTSVTSTVVSFANFANLPPNSYIDIGYATWSPASTWAFNGGYQVTDFITKISSGDNVPLSSTTPTVIFGTVYVPGDTCGSTTFTTSITLDSSAGTVDIPINLYVFNVLLDVTPHVDTYFQSTSLFTTGGGPLYNLTQLDAMHALYLQYRVAGAGAWPAGMNYQVAWDDTAHTLIDAYSPPSTTSCIWANGCDTLRYLNGSDVMWNGVLNLSPYPAGSQGKAAAPFVSTDNARPDPFGGHACNTAGTPYAGTPKFVGWMCDNAYETEWANYLKALVTWTNTNNFVNAEYPSKGFWYTKNEPQDYYDYTISAYLCQQAHTRAPGMKVMISREAHPWMYANGAFPCGYDIWMAHVNRWFPGWIWARQKLGETSWVYFLDSDASCQKNTTSGETVCSHVIAPFVSQSLGCNCYEAKATNDGMHYRGIAWILWSMRVQGFGYYLDNIIWDNSKMNFAGGWQPARARVSAHLMREGLEDYEYLYQANCRQRPAIDQRVPNVDPTALSIGAFIGSWNDDEASVHALRHELGLYLEGTRPDMPYLQTPGQHAFGDYYIDFTRDPGFTNTQFTFGGNTWIPIDMNQNFSVTKGFGWQGNVLGVPNQADGNKPWHHCDLATPNADPKATSCYDNSNHPAFFYFSIQPGTYTVTIGLGWTGSARNGDEEYVECNNVIIRNFSCSSSPGTCTGIRTYSGTITVMSHAFGGMIGCTIGSPFINEYTLFTHMTIIGVSAGTITDAPTCGPPTTPPGACGPTPPPTPRPTGAPTPPTTAPPPTEGAPSEGAPTESGPAGSLSGGAIAGIVIGVLIGVALLAALIAVVVYFGIIKKRNGEYA